MRKERVARIIGSYSIVLGILTSITIVGLFFAVFGILIELNLRRNLPCKNEIKILIIFYCLFFFLGLGLIALFTLPINPLVLIITTPIFLLIFGTPFTFSIIYLIKDFKNPTLLGEINIYCADKEKALKRLYEARMISKETWENKKESLLEKQK